MHLATLAQSVETIKELITFGAKVDEEDNEGRTPLHYAAVPNENSEMIKILIQVCASTNKADKFGFTPPHIAAMNENSHNTGMLLSEGGDMTARTKDGDIALNFIIQCTPDALLQFKTRLDQAISLQVDRLNNVNCNLLLNFRPLISSSCREMDLMLCLVEQDQGHILKHLCESFLHLKWRCIRKFFVLNFLFHLIFVAFFTSFICVTYL
ncbi:Transient receptor potential channel pyrexia [Camponotus floridanus]|uniref:Transient receptor potential channel pyrexia n=1 Tax=Camponotus floridanus TaxID=104421 RepID=E2ALA2_CAMFO|nr:Transient receptor potential channel pyrexia [Camponotus floridanus]